MATRFPSPFLVAGPAYCGLYHPRRQALGIFSEGLGDYYGITWSDQEIYVLARNGGGGEIILVFDRSGAALRRLSIGRDIDGHQILYHQNHLLLTASRENALIQLHPDTSTQVVWNWTSHSTDVNHINGLAPGPLGTVLVSLDNGHKCSSEIVLISPQGQRIGTLLTLPKAHLGSHNLEETRLVASAETSFVFELAGDREPRCVFSRSGEFFRGLGRCHLADGTVAWLVGSSDILSRELRSHPHTARVHLFAGEPASLIATLALPNLGQVYEIRSLDPSYPHHGIPCPLQCDDLAGITTWRKVTTTFPSAPG